MGSFLQASKMDGLGAKLCVFIFISLDMMILAKGSVSCSWGCTPIKECKVIYQDLVTAKIAREKQQNWKVDKIISLIRGYTCDNKAEQVCCPQYMGQFNNTITKTTNMIYAINKDTLVIRSNMEKSRWINTETFFWRDETCFPLLEYQVDLDYNDVEADEESFDEISLVLPGTLSLEDIRCLSVWDGDTEVGSAFLAWTGGLLRLGRGGDQLCGHCH